MTHRKLVLLIISLFLFLFSCNLLEETSSGDDLTKTQAAATVTAHSGGKEDPPTSPAPPPSLPPSTPIPASDPVLRIVYTDAGNIWLIEGPSPPVQLTSSGFAEQVLISSDSAKIAFTRRITPDDLAELRVVNVDGSGETVLLTTGDMAALYPSTLESKGFEIGQMAFLPGTHDLLFNTFEAFETVGLAMTDDLLQVNTDTGILTNLLPPGSGGQFASSPDGSRLVIIRPDSIDLANPDGSGLIPGLLMYAPVTTYSEFQYYAQPVWRGDSNVVGFAIPSDDPLGGSPSGDTWRIPHDGSSTANLATIPGDFYFSQVFSESTLSPNLNRVAFLRETGTTNIRDLYLANVDGYGELLYATGDIKWVGWASDSLHFVYSLGDPMNLQLGTDGSASSALVNGIDLRWINASEYVYLAGSLGSWTLMRGRIGMAPIVLANPSGDFISYDFIR